jgi:taurine dioxygenase
MVEAYKHLPEDIKVKIAGLRAKHGIEHSSARSWRPKSARNGSEEPAGGPPRGPDAPKPARKICTSGRSQRTSSTTTPRRTCASGRTRPRRGLLLNYLISQAAIPEYPVRFRWKPNSVALWDNVSTQHYAVSDYWPAPRRMERATIKGDRPF